MPASPGKPKVLVLTSTFPRSGSDTEPRFIFDLCRNLLDLAELRVVAPHAPGARLTETIDGVSVTRFRYFVPRWQAIAYEGGIVSRLRQNRWRLLQLPFFFAANWLAVRTLIREWRPDIIHAHWIVPQGLIACLCTREIPILCTSHGGDLFGLQGYWFKKVKAWVLKRCSGVTVVSESMVGPVRTLAPDATVDVIPMGTDLSRLFVPPASSSARGTRELVFVGRLVEKKGVGVLIAAFERVVSQVPDLELKIIGDGPLMADLQADVTRRGLAQSVSFAGSLSHQEIAEAFRRATIALFPFVVARDGDREGFGLVVVEAMGCGCPVIASDIPAVRQSTTHEVTGLLTPPGDVEALAQAIERLLSDGDLRAELASNANSSAKRRFDWGIIAAGYHQALQAALGRSRSA